MPAPNLEAADDCAVHPMVLCLNSPEPNGARTAGQPDLKRATICLIAGKMMQARNDYCGTLRVATRESSRAEYDGEQNYGQPTNFHSR